MQEALDTMSMLLASYFSWLTPITNMGASLEGAEMMTCSRGAGREVGGRQGGARGARARAGTARCGAGAGAA